MKKGARGTKALDTGYVGVDLRAGDCDGVEVDWLEGLSVKLAC